MGFVLTLKPITKIRTKANVWLRHGSVPNGSQFMTHQPVLNLNGIPSYNPRVASTLGISSNILFNAEGVGSMMR